MIRSLKRWLEQWRAPALRHAESKRRLEHLLRAEGLSRQASQRVVSRFFGGLTDA